MDAILGQDLAFDLARNLAAILAFHLAEILAAAIRWYFDLSFNHGQQHKWSLCFQDATLNHLCAALAVL